LYYIGNVEVKIYHIINGLITLYYIGNVEVKIHHIINGLITLYYIGNVEVKDMKYSNLNVTNTMQCYRLFKI
jgi:hypothetical protein